MNIGSSDWSALHKSSTDVNGSFSDVWFLSVPGLERETLALLFTAMCNDMEVTIFGDPDTSTLDYIYLKRD